MLRHSSVARPVSMKRPADHTTQVSIDRLRALAIAAITESRSVKAAPVQPRLVLAPANSNGAVASNAA